jgi:predicted GNAT superfamily acetyltransferase
VTVDTSTMLQRLDNVASVAIRPLTTHEELRACVELQRRTWGESFGEVVPPAMLKIAAHIGGVVTGAFEGNELVGFVFGITGIERGAVVHWSHMLGVLPRAQNHGIGRQLKDYQRSTVAKLGARVIYWTFDPLVARNAHLNFNKLGVRATSYARDMYGEGTSPLHHGIGTDRLIVAWPVSDPDVITRRQEIARFSSGDAVPVRRIEVPADIEALQTTDLASAQAWRARTRAEFETAFAEGLAIQGFRIDAAAKRGYYLLGRADA